MFRSDIASFASGSTRDLLTTLSHPHTRSRCLLLGAMRADLWNRMAFKATSMRLRVLHRNTRCSEMVSTKLLQRVNGNQLLRPSELPKG